MLVRRGHVEDVAFGWRPCPCGRSLIRLQKAPAIDEMSQMVLATEVIVCCFVEGFWQP